MVLRVQAEIDPFHCALRGQVSAFGQDNRTVGDVGDFVAHGVAARLVGTAVQFREQLGM